MNEVVCMVANRAYDFITWLFWYIFRRSLACTNTKMVPSINSNTDTFNIHLSFYFQGIAGYPTGLISRQGVLRRRSSSYKLWLCYNVVFVCRLKSRVIVEKCFHDLIESRCCRRLLMGMTHLHVARRGIDLHVARRGIALHVARRGISLLKVDDDPSSLLNRVVLPVVFTPLHLSIKCCRLCLNSDSGDE